MGQAVKAGMMAPIASIDTLLTNRKLSAEQRKATEALVAKAVSRIGAMGMARAFSSWKGHTEVTTYMLHVAVRAVSNLHNPKLNVGWVRWIEWCEQRTAALATVKATMLHLQRWPEIAALQTWIRVAVGRSKERELRRLGRTAIARLHNPLVVGAFLRLKKIHQLKAMERRLTGTQFAHEKRAKNLCEAISRCMVRSP